MAKTKQQMSDEQKSTRVKWFDSRNGCIAVIAVCLLFISVFILNIVLNHNWASGIFIIPYGMIVSNRLKQLRRLADG